MVDLDVLAGRDVTLLQRSIGLDCVCEGIHLVRGDAAVGQLDPDHLNPGLALAVDTLLQTETDELRLRSLTVEEELGFIVEINELVLEDRDQSAGHILVGLRVVERAELALALLDLAFFLLHAFVSRLGSGLRCGFFRGRARLHR